MNYSTHLQHRYRTRRKCEVVTRGMMDTNLAAMTSKSVKIDNQENKALQFPFKVYVIYYHHQQKTWTIVNFLKIYSGEPPTEYACGDIPDRENPAGRLVHTPAPGGNISRTVSQALFHHSTVSFPAYFTNMTCENCPSDKPAPEPAPDDNEPLVRRVLQKCTKFLPEGSALLSSSCCWLPVCPF
jgi:hypothetical protein